MAVPFEALLNTVSQTMYLDGIKAIYLFAYIEIARLLKAFNFNRFLDPTEERFDTHLPMYISLETIDLMTMPLEFILNTHFHNKHSDEMRIIYFLTVEDLIFSRFMDLGPKFIEYSARER